MNWKLSIGLFVGLLVVGGGFIALNVKSVVAANPIQINYCQSCGFGNFAAATQSYLNSTYGITSTLNPVNSVGTFNAQLPNGQTVPFGGPGGTFSDNGPAVGGVANSSDVKKFGDSLAKAVGAEPLPPQANDTICLVPRPGQDAKFGNITDQPIEYPIQGDLQDVDIGPASPLHVAESKLNYDLRRLGSDLMPIELAQAQATGSKDGGKQITITPNSSQAQEYVASMGGNPNTRGSYTIGGTKVPVGKYKANDTGDPTGIVFDEKCENPKQGVPGGAPAPGTPKAPAAPGAGPYDGLNNKGGGNPGGGSPGGMPGGAGGLGGMSAMLPLMLMQSLLGGQQGGGQGQGGQGQPGSPTGIPGSITGNPALDSLLTQLLQALIGNIGTGTGGIPRPTPVATPGVTPTTNPIPSATPILIDDGGMLFCDIQPEDPSCKTENIVQQLTGSGVAQGVVIGVMNAVSSILTHTPAGQVTVP